ncbi:MAG: hypothetical protein HFJ21_01995 [Clostridia bacterium]|nr:hypothetical protein [Clostridia bacterium]
MGISIDDRFSESHYFPHTNENSALKGRFSRFAEVSCFAAACRRFPLSTEAARGTSDDRCDGEKIFIGFFVFIAKRKKHP